MSAASEQPEPRAADDGEAPLRTALALLASLIFAVLALYVVGLVVSWVRFATARLPADAASSVIDNRQLFGTGFRSTALTLAAFALLCALAYLLSGRRWDVNGADWHELIDKRGVRQAQADPTRADRRTARVQAHKARVAARRAQLAARLPWRRGAAGDAQPPDQQGSDISWRGEVTAAPAGEPAVRIIAGFNILVLAVLGSLIVARLVEDVIPHWWAFAASWALAFAALYQLLTHVDVLGMHAGLHWLPWVLVAIAALFASAPFGVLVLTGVGVSTFGRALGRVQRPRSLSALMRSPLPWALLAVVILLSLSYNAMPPVAFPRAVVTTASGAQVIGGYLDRGSGGVSVVTCTPLADATSTGEQVRLLSDARALTLNGGSTFTVDSGDRPSLLTLGLRALSVNGAVRPLFHADLRPRQGTCGGVLSPALTRGSENAALGAGVIVPSARPGVQAHDGEPPIEADGKTPAQIAAYARRYQPTLLVTVADRFWPVSLDGLLADVNSAGKPTCLIQTRPPQTVCAPSLTADSLAGPGATSNDYLQFPTPLEGDPFGRAQFSDFLRGQSIFPGPLRAWLSDPGRLDPWYTAQIYFYWGRPVTASSFPSKPGPGFSGTYIPLEYWFYYPYNYYPLVTTQALMDAAPVAGDDLNVDLHQGDWEHIDVLLDQTTLQPRWLYLARHANEGQLIQWSSPSVALDDGHPLVQAAIGGHPTYEPGCGPQIRNQPGQILTDWLACGSGRFAFRAANTPLVNIAIQPWACWPGHFGEAWSGPEKRAAATAAKNESLIDAARNQVYVAGPNAPVRQAENTGTCGAAGGAVGPEQAAVTRYFSVGTGTGGGTATGRGKKP